jgi:choline dehydrogenase-like flavoprotein
MTATHAVNRAGDGVRPEVRLLADARRLPAGHRLGADVCIVGAGAAGIALALELAGSPLRVVLLESGGFERDEQTQALYRGRIFGRRYPPLDEVRSRWFGGTTSAWLGRLRPLDPDDFEPREWIPHSGWPISARELAPFVARAARSFGLEEPAAGAASNEAPPLPLDPEAFESRELRIAPVRFGERHRGALTAAANVDTWLHANAVELVANEAGSALSAVRVATLAGGAFSVRARAFVLAAGGIENPRLLLASNRASEAGLGNAADLVGRFFMEHPQLVAGALLPASAELPLGLYRPRPQRGAQSVALLAPAAALLRRERIQSFAVLLAGDAALPDLERSLAQDVCELEGAAGGPARRALLLVNSCEQAPNPASRVRLSEERDALGMARVQLEWRLSPSDLHALRRGHELLARELGRAGVGRLQLMLGPGDMDWPPDLGGSGHHLGTTRMHEDPRRGVVDASSRVHGLANLYVAGSSVFPTSGAADPTLTIVALAIRLADHLRRELA